MDGESSPKRGSVLHWLGRLVVPGVPEPVTEGTWRNLQRLVFWLSAILPWLNVASRFLAPDVDQGNLAAFDAFLVSNIACHAVNFVIAAVLLNRPFDEREARLGLYLILPLAYGTSLGALWLLGSVTNVVNILFIVVIIASARMWMTTGFGLWALGSAIVMHGSLVALEIAGVLQPHAALPELEDPYYVDETAHAIAFGWVCIVYTFGWALASFAALRFRESEHALSTLNASLEQRVRDQVAELQRSGRLRRYLAPQVVDQLLSSEGEELPRERRPITVFFCDLRGFTTLVERLEAEDLAELLNQYLDLVATVAFEHGGTVDKFIGDAAMVFFGAPRPTTPQDQAERCVRMALDVMRKLGPLRRHAAERWGAEIGVRVGIASGVATVGDFGARHRMEFTAVGSPVNLAARLEARAPTDGILIDPETHRLVASSDIGLTPFGAQQLKGFDQPVQTWLVQPPREPEEAEVP